MNAVVQEILRFGIDFLTLLLLVAGTLLIPTFRAFVKFMKEMRDLVETMGNRVTAIEARNKYADMLYANVQDEIRFLRQIILEKENPHSGI